METVLNMVIDPDNVRMVLMVVLGWSGFVLINSKISNLRGELKGDISELRGELKGDISNLRGELKGDISELRGELTDKINELKHNDIAHLYGSIEALTYALEKNNILTRDDKEYVDSRLTK